MKTTEKLCVLIMVIFVFAGKAAAFTEGYLNNFFGTDAGAFNEGQHNIFMGGNAGYNNTSGDDNTFYGYQAGYSNISGDKNTFNGYRAGFRNTAGYSNTFNGYTAGYNNTEGIFNTFYGSKAGYKNTSGIANTFNGYMAGYNNTTGYGNVFLGYQAGYNETGSNRLYIDNSTTSLPLIWGDFISNYVNINGSLGVGTSSPSSPLTVAGVIESTSGGIKFPDGTTQTTASAGGGGDITGVTAGTGLTGGGTSGTVTLNVNFAGSGAATTASRSDHGHAGSDITSGTVGEIYIDSLIARDSEIMPTVLANDGSASTLDADLLDGQDSSAFMSASTDSWVNTTGDTMTGDLIVEGSVEIDLDLFVNGNTYVDSDENLKQDIQPIESSLEKIKNIKGVSFAWKESEKRERTRTEGRHYGVIAQDVEQVLPEIVKAGQNNTKKVAYMELIPVLIEAVKEQQEIITKLSEKIKNLEKELTLKGSLAMADID